MGLPQGLRDGGFLSRVGKRSTCPGTCLGTGHLPRMSQRPPLPPHGSDGTQWAHPLCPLGQSRSAPSRRGGGSEKGGLAGTPPPPRVPRMVPAEGGPKSFQVKSSWHQRRRSKILAASLKHWKGRRGGESRQGGGGGAPLLLRCTAVLNTSLGGWGWRSGTVQSNCEKLRKSPGKLWANAGKCGAATKPPKASRGTTSAQAAQNASASLQTKHCGKKIP